MGERVLSAQVSHKTVAQLMEAFKQFKRAEGRMRRTLLDYDRVFSDVLKSIGDIPLSELKLGTLRNYVHSLMERGWKTATINVYVRVLRCWLHWLYQEGYLNENLADHIKPLRAPRQYPYVLSDAQAVALIQAAKQQGGRIGARDHTVMLTFLDAMLRLSELIALELADVSLQARSIRVRHGKGDKERVVFMGRRLTRSLRDWLQVRGHSEGEDRLFTARGGGGLTKRGAHELVRRLGRAAKIDDQRVSPHTLRHTGATLFIRHGGDPFSLQRLLGHSDISTTMVYVHMAGVALREAHAKASPVDRLLEG